MSALRRCDRGTGGEGGAAVSSIPALLPKDSVPEIAFESRYLGPAVDEGRMDARAFAEALYGFTDLLQRSSERLLGDRQLVRVEVDARFQQGSFEFLLVIAAAAGQSIVAPLEQLQSITNAIGITGKFEDSLLGLFLKLRGYKVSKIEPRADGTAHISVVGDNNVVVVAQPEVGRLFADAATRRAAEQMLAPIDGAGVTALQVGDRKASRPPMILQDLQTLQSLPPVTSVLTDTVQQTALEIIAPNFRDGNKWRVSQGGEPYWVLIDDDKFLQAVDEGLTFAKGDFLIVDLRVIAVATPNGLDVERRVLRVVDQRRRSLPQQSLFQPAP